MPYTQTSWTTLQTALQNRLDPFGVFYTNTGIYPEIQVYLREALRAWNAYAFRWRQRITITFGPGAQWYDIHSASPMTQTITDQMLVAEIQHHFMEPATGSTWVGSDMFTLADLTAALQKRMDQMLLESGIEEDFGLMAVVPVWGRFEMPNTVIDVRRLAWLDQITGLYSPLYRTDPWQATSYSQDWTYNPSIVPYEYSVGETPPLQVQLIPPNMNPGQVEYIVVNSGPTLNPVAGVILGIHDDLCWGIKYGAMADLLAKNNQARDPSRAAYAEERFRECVQLAEVLPHAMMVEIAGQPATIVPVADLDAHQPNWENTTGTPQMLGISHHQLTLYPRPAANTVVTMDVLRPAPQPVLGTDFIQLGKEELNAILDYAQHIATFKEGGVEFQSTSRLRQNFLQLAAYYNDKLRAVEFYKEMIEKQSDKEEEIVPRKVSESGD